MKLLLTRMQLKIILNLFDAHNSDNSTTRYEVVKWTK